jgi:hypothetical protein
MSPERQERPEGEGAYARLAITLPRETARRVRAEVRDAAAPSVSAYIARAVEEKLERESLQEILDEIFRGNPLTDDERAWADRALGL